MWEKDEAALAAFCSGNDGEFTPELRRIVSVSAESGKYWHDWHRLRQLLHFRLNQVVKAIGSPSPDATNANGSDGDGEKAVYGVLKRLATQLASFEDAAPFTLQRICELLLQPPESFSRIDKFELAFERLLLVTSTLAISTDPETYPRVEVAATEENDAKEGEESRN